MSYFNGIGIDSLKKRGKKYTNYFIFFLSVCCAIVMWYMVSKSNEVEAQIEVKLDYKDIPDNIIITRGLISKLTVQVRAPEALIRSLTKAPLHQTINLKNIKLNNYTYPFDTQMLKAFENRAFKIIDIDPPKLELKVSEKFSKSVNIEFEPRTMDPLVTWADLTYVNNDEDNKKSVSQELNPSILLTGPKEEVEEIKTLKVPVRIEPNKENPETHRVVETIILETKNFITADPPSIKVSYLITSERIEKMLECPVQPVISSNGEFLKLEPEKLKVMVRVNPGRLKKESYLKEFYATINQREIEGLKKGESIRVKPEFHLPDGMVLLKNDETVLVSWPENEML